MAAYNDRVPLKDGTVLHTTDGKRFHILHSTSIGGSAILYSAHLDGSSLDVTLKEFYPAGCVRVNGSRWTPALPHRMPLPHCGRHFTSGWSGWHSTNWN